MRGTHIRPGQVLIVTAGVGWVQEWQGPKREIREGDVIWTPAGVKHWHGATASTSMTHIAIQEVVDDQNVAWLELVTDAQYEQPAAQAPPRQGFSMKSADDLEPCLPPLTGTPRQH